MEPSIWSPRVSGGTASGRSATERLMPLSFIFRGDSAPNGGDTIGENMSLLALLLAVRST
jgi:hypothetical protein